MGSILTRKELLAGATCLTGLSAAAGFAAAYVCPCIPSHGVPAAFGCACLLFAVGVMAYVAIDDFREAKAKLRNAT